MRASRAGRWSTDGTSLMARSVARAPFLSAIECCDEFCALGVAEFGRDRVAHAVALTSSDGVTAAVTHEHGLVLHDSWMQRAHGSAQRQLLWIVDVERQSTPVGHAVVE